MLIEGKFREVADKNSYIKDNYISKDKIREKIKYKEDLILQIENYTLLKNQTEKEKNELQILETEIKAYKDLLEEE